MESKRLTSELNNQSQMLKSQILTLMSYIFAKKSKRLTLKPKKLTKESQGS
jgi:hypothetical protein